MINLRRALATKGIHFLVTRFGWRKLRSLAFDGKYQSGDWTIDGDETSELPTLVTRYLRKGDLLIMGCGGASVLEGLEAQGLNSALGIDLSEEAIRFASRFASAKVSFQVADMETFACPKPYDVILFSESLYYVSATNQEAFLRRLGIYLKPSGVIVVTFAQAKRYQGILAMIRSKFVVLEDRNFPQSTRHLIVFQPH